MRKQLALLQLCIGILYLVAIGVALWAVPRHPEIAISMCVVLTIVRAIDEA